MTLSDAQQHNGGNYSYVGLRLNVAGINVKNEAFFLTLRAIGRSQDDRTRTIVETIC